MLLTLVNVFYVLVAVAMVVLILLQRGSGAAAGSGFGGGASATVFGARGSANFLSKSTAVLAAIFFVLSLGMAVYASRSSTVAPAVDDLGVMGGLSEAPAVSDAPLISPAAEVPVVEAPVVELAPAVDAPVVEQPVEDVKEDAQGDETP
ncbi:MAG: preprotein translocase subunit SecG [Lysobacteraceae bacterium]